jgi:hypothetical protein
VDSDLRGHSIPNNGFDTLTGLLSTIHYPLFTHLLATRCVKLACNIGVLITESLAILNSGLERIPAREVAINVAIVATWSDLIPGIFQLIAG